MPTLRDQPNHRYTGLRLHRIQTATFSIAVMAGCSTNTASLQPLVDQQEILSIGGSYQASDAVHLLPMLEPIQANTDQHPVVLIAVAARCVAVADSFYTAYLVACEEKTIIPTNST